MSTIKYPIKCTTCSSEYNILDKKCSNCNAKNSNAFYKYLTEKKTILFYIKWLILGIFSLPSILVAILIVILGSLGIMGIGNGLFFIGIIALLLPFSWIYYLIVGDSHFFLDDKIINEIHKLGIENIHLTYLVEFFGIILVLILGFALFFTIFYIIAFLVSIIFEKKTFDILDSYGYDEISFTGLFLIPLSHSIYKYKTESEEKAIDAFDASRKSNLLAQNRYFTEDFKLMVYNKFSHKIENKINEIQSSAWKIEKIEKVLDTINTALSDDELIEFMKEEDILDYSHVEFYNQKSNRYKKEDLTKNIKERNTYFFLYSLPWRGYGYGSEEGYILTKSALINVLAYGIAIGLWYIIIVNS